DITAGLPPQDYSDTPYIEFYSEENGRVVLELDPHQVEVIGTPRPWQDEKPVSREEQEKNMGHFLAGLSASLGVAPIVVGGKRPAPGSAPEGEVDPEPGRAGVPANQGVAGESKAYRDNYDRLTRLLAGEESREIVLEGEPPLAVERLEGTPLISL